MTDVSLEMINGLKCKFNIYYNLILFWITIFTWIKNVKYICTN